MAKDGLYLHKVWSTEMKGKTGYDFDILLEELRTHLICCETLTKAEKAAFCYFFLSKKVTYIL